MLCIGKVSSPYQQYDSKTFPRTPRIASDSFCLHEVNDVAVAFFSNDFTLNNIMKSLVILLIFFTLLVGGTFSFIGEQLQVEKENLQIRLGIGITENDLGDLPLNPSLGEKDATVAGVDSNKNNIRDEVERILREKYTFDYFDNEIDFQSQDFDDSLKDIFLAAALQYAQALQVILTSSEDTELHSYVIENKLRAESCITEVSMPRFTQEYIKAVLSGTGQKKLREIRKNEDVRRNQLSNKIKEYVLGVVVNNKQRKNIYSRKMSKSAGSFIQGESFEYPCFYRK